MKILWICNSMPSVVAGHFKQEATNKEGWLSGLCNVIMEKQKENRIELALAFPVSMNTWIWGEYVPIGGGKVVCYGFYEDTAHPEVYDEELKLRLLSIVGKFEPDVVHCFGTEYAHTCAICEAMGDKSRLLVGIQGLCSVYANAYFADLPKRVIRRATIRDILKNDSIRKQRDKFVKRGMMEIRAVKAAGNVTGRTAWDKCYTNEWNPDASYYMMNETLRPEFYEGEWKEENCIPYSVFLSQGDYPIKGLHYMLLALPLIREKYPQVKVYVAGNAITGSSFYKRLKISSYGKYIRELIKREGLKEHVEFLGKLNAQQMKERYLKSNLYVCCSSIENSPNSLGEAMILGMPCISAEVGGVASIFTDGEDGLLYEGFKTPENIFDINFYGEKVNEYTLENSVRSLAEAVIKMWEDREMMLQFCKNARKHAKSTHNRELNYKKMQEIYTEIVEKQG